MYSDCKKVVTRFLISACILLVMVGCGRDISVKYSPDGGKTEIIELEITGPALEDATQLVP